MAVYELQARVLNHDSACLLRVAESIRRRGLTFQAVEPRDPQRDFTVRPTEFPELHASGRGSGGAKAFGEVGAPNP